MLSKDISITKPTILRSERSGITVINQTSNNDQEVENLTGIKILDHYNIIAELQTVSGEAVIYLAMLDEHVSKTHQISINTPVVVKMYKRKNAVSREVLERLAKLKSPSIVELIDYGEYKGYPCTILPLFVKQSLQGVKLSFEQIRDIVVPDVVSGLKYLHSHGIIHRDIKPENLMITNDGKHIQIIDFGISEALYDNLQIAFSREGFSYDYCSPESFNGLWLEESDYYSLGITLYEIFKGDTPFGKKLSLEESVSMTSLSKISFSDDFPQALKQLIKGLTYKDLSNRFELSNPNRRWTWREVEKWLRNEELQTPGENAINEKIVDSDERRFAVPFVFKNRNKEILYIYNISELISSLGRNSDEGKIYLGRGKLSQFCKNNGISNLSKIFEQYENDKYFDDLVYFKMICELQKYSNDRLFYWKNFGYSEPAGLAEYFKNLYNDLEESKDLYTVENDFRASLNAIIIRYRILKYEEKLKLINNFLKICKTKKFEIFTILQGLISFYDPNLKIKVGEYEFNNIESLNDSLKLLSNICPKSYISFIKDNFCYLEKLKCYIDPQIRNFAIIHGQSYRNPVLNSPDDISDELIFRIAHNQLDSLVINYEFCSNDKHLSGNFYYAENGGLLFQKLNPFRIAYNSFGFKIKRLEFEIILGPDVHSLRGAFAGIETLEYVNLLCTKNITDLSNLFNWCKSFNQPIANWDTSNVTDMNSMFSCASSFNYPIGSWDTSNVTDMSYMFHFASSFEQDISNWNVSKVKTHYRMFEQSMYIPNFMPKFLNY